VKRSIRIMDVIMGGMGLRVQATEGECITVIKAL